MALRQATKKIYKKGPFKDGPHAALYSSSSSAKAGDLCEKKHVSPARDSRFLGNDGGNRHYRANTAFTASPISARLRTVFTPAASSAANLSSAVPLPPAMMFFIQFINSDIC